jgi:hypothetical protein
MGVFALVTRVLGDAFTPPRFSPCIPNTRRRIDASLSCRYIYMLLLRDGMALGR